MELYIHIPFCVRKCRYCDFASFPATAAQMDHYVDLLLLEAARARDRVCDPFQSIYLGGGTPSLLSPAQLKRLLEGIRGIFGWNRDAECSMEANPGTLTPERLNTALENGVNRLSIGMQARQDRLLAGLGRIHRYSDVVSSVKEARKAGFTNVSLDLMFGLPGQTRLEWRETLAAALSLEPTHLSAYGLIPEESTPLWKDLEAGKCVLPEPEEEREMYAEAKDVLNAAGFIQYEISNFALPGYECRHNIGYWTQVPYLGLGLSAASMGPIHRLNGGIQYERKVNPHEFSVYEAMILENESGQKETEIVTPPQARFETMMLGLRMTAGVSETDFRQMHGISLEECYGNTLRQLASCGLMRHTDGRWALTDRGMDVQNTVLVELME